MKDLLQISTSTIGAENVNSVNAREIHEYLEVKTHLSTWIKRAIEKYDFEENIDFSILKSGNPNGGISKIDYIVTLDMAKELAMLENNPKGKEIRKYFISFEKKAKNIINNQSSQIQILKETLNQISIMDSRVSTSEKKLDNIESTMRIHNWQQKKLEQVKNQKVYELVEKHDFQNDTAMIRKLHSRTWKAFKNRFSIPRYNELPICEFENGVSFIQRLNLGDII
jgi:phage anti-repressor protein